MAGAAAGGVATTFCYPLDLIRTRLTTQLSSVHVHPYSIAHTLNTHQSAFEIIITHQNNQASHYNGIMHALLRITKEEGIFGLYNGLGSTLLCQVPNLAIGYSVYGYLRDRVMGVVDASALPATSPSSSRSKHICRHCNKPFELLEPSDSEVEAWLPHPDHGSKHITLTHDHCASNTLHYAPIFSYWLRCLQRTLPNSWRHRPQICVTALIHSQPCQHSQSHTF